MLTLWKGQSIPPQKGIVTTGLEFLFFIVKNIFYSNKVSQDGSIPLLYFVDMSFVLLSRTMSNKNCMVRLHACMYVCISIDACTYGKRDPVSSKGGRERLTNCPLASITCTVAHTQEEVCLRVNYKSLWLHQVLTKQRSDARSIPWLFLFPLSFFSK